jgi:hypothetical protein
MDRSIHGAVQPLSQSLHGEECELGTANDEGDGESGEAVYSMLVSAHYMTDSDLPAARGLEEIGMHPCFLQSVLAKFLSGWMGLRTVRLVA